MPARRAEGARQSSCAVPAETCGAFPYAALFFFLPRGGGKPPDGQTEPAVAPAPRAPAPETATEPDTVPAARIVVYDAEQLDALASGQALPADAPADSPIPTPLWPVYGNALSMLRRDFAHRRDGAVILHAAQGGGPVTASWRVDGGDAVASRHIPAGGAVVFCATGGSVLEFETISSAGVDRRQWTAERGRVGYVVIGP